MDACSLQLPPTSGLCVCRAGYQPGPAARPACWRCRTAASDVTNGRALNKTNERTQQRVCCVVSERRVLVRGGGEYSRPTNVRSAWRLCGTAREKICVTYMHWLAAWRGTARRLPIVMLYEKRPAAITRVSELCWECVCVAVRCQSIPFHSSASLRVAVRSLLCNNNERHRSADVIVVACGRRGLTDCCQVTHSLTCILSDTRMCDWYATGTTGADNAMPVKPATHYPCWRPVNAAREHG